MKNTIAAVGILSLMLTPAQFVLAAGDCGGEDELRHYSGHVARWLGVDPLADKYPDVSPYAYCEYNPLMYVDPNGEKLHLSGDETDAGFDQLQKSTQLELQIGDDGYVSYNDTESRKSLTKADKKLKKIIDSDKILVDLECTSAIVANGTWFLGGTFDGSTKTSDGTIVARQYLNPTDMQKIDELLKRDLYSGAIGALHEVLEAYFLARSNPGMSAVRFVNNMESDGKADLKTRKSFRQFMSGHKKANRVDPRHKDDCSSYIQYVEDQPGLCEIGICINNNYYFFHFIKVKQ